MRVPVKTLFFILNLLHLLNHYHANYFIIRRFRKAVNQLGDHIDVVTEPERRDTFPAIALAASYLKYEKSCADEEVVVVMPCDPFTEAGYFKVIEQMVHAVDDNVA